MPSVWRETGCESHFFVWRSEVDWLDWYSWGTESIEPAICMRVFEALRGELRSVHEIALESDVALRTAFLACRRLVDDGRAVEGEGRDRGLFRAVS